MCYNLSFFNNKQPQPVIGQGGSHETVPLVGQNPTYTSPSALCLRPGRTWPKSGGSLLIKVDG